MRSKTPTWHREAVERGIDYVIFFREQGEGFAWAPKSLDAPFGLGGTHSGTHPVSARYVLDHGLGQLGERYLPRIRWFLPFLEKIAAGEDFSLDELDLDRRSVRLVTGPWPG